MTLITIPKKLAQKDDLVVIPRQEYEALLERKRIREFKPTAAQKRALLRARRDFAKGRFVTLEQVHRALASRRSS